jgi:hypothetical protein
VRDYLPDLLAIDRTRFPAIRDIRAALGPVDVRPIPIPADCTDGFLGAYWQRPEAYLELDVRQCISSFGRDGDFGPGLERLSDDIASGTWAKRYRDLRGLRGSDVDYRLIVADAALDRELEGPTRTARDVARISAMSR